MLSLEALAPQLSALMRTEVRAALTELGGLLEECAASAAVMAARRRSAPEREEDESRETPTEESRSFTEAVKVPRYFLKIAKKNHVFCQFDM